MSIYINRIAPLLTLIMLLVGLSTDSLAQDRLDCVSDKPNAEYVELAYDQYTRGFIDLAVESLTCAISSGYVTDETYAFRGLMYLAMEQPTEALIDFNSAIALNDSISNYFYFRGIAYSFLQNFELAIENFIESINVEPSNPHYYFALAEIYMQIEEIDEAEQILNQAVATNPDNASVHAQRGYFYNAIGDHDKSEKDITIAIELDPMIASVYFDKGIVEFSTNFWDMAITSFTIALLLEPEYVEAYRQRAVAYIKLEETEKANNDIDQTFEIDHDPTHYKVIAYIYHTLGDSENALINYKKYQSVVGEEIDDFTLAIIESLEEELESE